VVGMMYCSRKDFKGWCFTCVYCFWSHVTIPLMFLPIVSCVNPFIFKLEGRGERGERVRERGENGRELERGGEEGRSCVKK